MAVEIKVPSVGESISEVTIGKWLKKAGDAVAKDEIVLALETDKVNVEVPAPEAGTLGDLRKKEGETATIGEVVAVIEAGKGAAPAASQASKPKSSDAPKTTVADSRPKARADGSGAGAQQGGVMPAAQRMMAEQHMQAGSVTGSGPGGRVLKEDVQRAGSPQNPAASPKAAATPGSGEPAQARSAAPAKAATPPPPPPPQAPADDGSLTRTVPMTTLRRRIAERLVEAQRNAAILTTFNEVDMTHVMELRKSHQERFVQRYGIKLGFMSFFIKAAVAALRAYPDINAEISGTNIIYRDYYDIGVAVGGDKGLVVPVVRRAELYSFAELERIIADFGTRARDGKLKLDEMTGGTFTISNGGVYGSLMSTPILNPPQSGILGMHSIVERPVGVNGKIELRPMMYIALSYDHRMVDGKGAVSFLKMVKEGIEAPERLLIEI